MDNEKENMDRTFMKTSLATGAGLVLAGSMGPLAWGSSASGTGLANLSLYQLSKMIRTKELSSKKLVELYLDRIKKFSKPDGINAYITVAGDAAMREAERLDNLAKQNKFIGPLHGLPIAVKDNLDTKNIRTTGGSKILESWTPPQDANVIKKLKEAGAIIIGKTNMHEFAFGITTNNLHYGPTRNPYDLSRIPGGSSGGSAAAVAASLCSGAIGTDTGGSVRIPAALCGVVGLKPTLGRVGRGGMMYLSATRDVIGPITQTVKDAALILEAISGIDARDYGSSKENIPNYISHLKGGLKGKRFGVPRKYFFDNIHPDTEKTINEAIKTIKSLGGSIIEVEVKHMDIAIPTGFNIVLTECIYHLENYLKKFDPEATIEKYQELFGADVSGPIVGSKTKPVPGYVYAESILDGRNKIISGFEDTMSGLDGLLLPTTPLPAAKIGDDVETDLLGKKVNTFLTFIKNCDPISVAGYPAITVPAGYSSSGLPIGLQIVSRPWTENQLLSMAYAFEQATQIRKSPIL